MNLLIIILLLVVYINVIIGYNNNKNRLLTSSISLKLSSSNSELGPDRMYSNANEGPDKNNVQYNVITQNKVRIIICNIIIILYYINIHII